jgi:hypothetical protein
MLPTFYAELLHTFDAKLVIDITPLNGTFAWTCMQYRVGSVGIVFTEVQAEFLYARVRDLIKTEMADSASKLFNREYAKACKVLTGGGNGEGKDGGGTGGSHGGRPSRGGGRGRDRGGRRGGQRGPGTTGGQAEPEEEKTKTKKEEDPGLGGEDEEPEEDQEIVRPVGNNNSGPHIAEIDEEHHQEGEVEDEEDEEEEDQLTMQQQLQLQQQQLATDHKLHNHIEAVRAIIDQLKQDDEVIIQTAGNWYVYKLILDEIVEPDAMWVLDPNPGGIVNKTGVEEMITLTTCHPRWGSTERWIWWGVLTEVRPYDQVPESIAAAQEGAVQ